MFHCVYTTSNAEECFLVSVFLSLKEANRWIRNVNRRKAAANKLFIVSHPWEEPIMLEVK